MISEDSIYIQGVYIINHYKIDDVPTLMDDEVSVKNP